VSETYSRQDYTHNKAIKIYSIYSPDHPTPRSSQKVQPVSLITLSFTIFQPHLDTISLQTAASTARLSAASVELQPDRLPARAAGWSAAGRGPLRMRNVSPWLLAGTNRLSPPRRFRSGYCVFFFLLLSMTPPLPWSAGTHVRKYYLRTDSNTT
jgi:hypothetical protein